MPRNLSSRITHYRKLYADITTLSYEINIENLLLEDEREMRHMIVPRNAAGAKVGRAFVEEGQLHRFLMEHVPDKFPRSVDFLAHSRTRKVKKLRKKDVTRHFSGKDWRRFGLTKNEGLRLAKEAIENGYDLSSEQKLREYIDDHTTREFAMRPPVLIDQAYEEATQSWKVDHDGFIGDYMIYFTALAEKAGMLVRERLQQTKQSLQVSMAARIVCVKVMAINEEWSAAKKAVMEAVHDNEPKSRISELIDALHRDERQEFVIITFISPDESVLVQGRGNVDEAMVTLRGNVMRKLADEWRRESNVLFITAKVGYIDLLDINTHRGGSYIEMPKGVKGCINPHNDDDQCLFWACIAAVHGEELGNKDLQRISKLRRAATKYKYEVQDEWFPVNASANELERFERMFQSRVHVLEWDYDSERPNPLYYSDSKFEREIVLLLLVDPQQNDKFHYVWVNNVTALFGCDGSGHKVYRCLRCLWTTTKKHLWEHHPHDCIGANATRVSLPSAPPKGEDETDEAFEQREEDFVPTQEFTKWAATQRLPVVGYWDTEKDQTHDGDTQPCGHCRHGNLVNQCDECPPPTVIGSCEHGHSFDECEKCRCEHNILLKDCKLCRSLLGLCASCRKYGRARTCCKTYAFPVFHRGIPKALCTKCSDKSSNTTFIGEQKINSIRLVFWDCINKEVFSPGRKVRRIQRSTYYRSKEDLVNGIPMTSKEVSQWLNMYDNPPEIRTCHTEEVVIPGEDRFYWEFRGRDCMRAFIDQYCKATLQLNRHFFLHPKKISWTSESKKAYNEADKCLFCKGYFLQKGDLKKVAHHCHFENTDNVKGAAHSKCNLQASVTQDFPLYAHNASAYDNHTMITTLTSKDYKKIDVIAENSEKWKSIKLSMEDTESMHHFSNEERKMLREWDFHYHEEKSVIHKKSGEVYTDEKRYKELLRVRRLVKHNSRCKYTVSLYDSMLLLQDSLDGVTKSMGEDKFRLIKEIAHSHIQPLSRLEQTFDFIEPDDTGSSCTLLSKVEEFNELGAAFSAKYDEKGKPATFKPLPSTDAYDLTFDICRRKGTYPYEWATPERLESTEWPKMRDFFSRLQHGEDPDTVVAKDGHQVKTWSDKDRAEVRVNYLLAQIVRRWLGHETFWDYHSFYLETDVGQLCDVMEATRDVFMEGFGIDPCHFPTLPGSGWASMLKFTKVKLQLFSKKQQDMYEFCEKMIRGGISGSGTRRRAQANNPSCPEYDKSQAHTWQAYTDKNSLYANAMCEKLPIGDFAWRPEPEKFDCGNTDCRGDTGYFVEVDVHLPRCSQGKFAGCDGSPTCICNHKRQEDYPGLPELRPACYNDLSDLQKLSCNYKPQGNDINPKGEDKLMCTLEPKTRYKVHLKTLQFWMRQGWVVTKVYRVLQFIQEAWLKPFIMECLRRRKACKTDFEKAFWKLLCNSCFGRTMEDVRKQKDTILIATTGEEERFNRIRNSLRIRGAPPIKHLSEHLMAVFRKKITIKLNKPIYAGAAILDLSKLEMASYWYDDLKDKYGDSLHLIMTDTDSFLFIVTTPNLYTDILANRDEYDLSDMPENLVISPEGKLRYLRDGESAAPGEQHMHDPKNKKVGGKMKLEHIEAIWKAVSIRSKMYAYMKSDGKTDARLKGIKKSARKQLAFESYWNCIDPEAKSHEKTMRMTAYNLRTINHRTYLERCTKVSLSCFNDKMYVCRDGVRQLPWGHAEIANKP